MAIMERLSKLRWIDVLVIFVLVFGIIGSNILTATLAVKINDARADFYQEEYNKCKESCRMIDDNYFNAVADFNLTRD